MAPSEDQGPYLAFLVDHGEETFPEDPGTQRVASCLEVADLVVDLVSQTVGGRATS